MSWCRASPSVRSAAGVCHSPQRIPLNRLFLSSRMVDLEGSPLGRSWWVVDRRSAGGRLGYFFPSKVSMMGQDGIEIFREETIDRSLPQVDGSHDPPYPFLVDSPNRTGIRTDWLLLGSWLCVVLGGEMVLALPGVEESSNLGVRTCRTTTGGTPPRCLPHRIFARDSMTRIERKKTDDGGEGWTPEATSFVRR